MNTETIWLLIIVFTVLFATQAGGFLAGQHLQTSKDKGAEPVNAPGEIHVKVETGGGDTHELDVAPTQTVADGKKALEQKMGAPAYQQQLTEIHEVVRI